MATVTWPVTLPGCEAEGYTERRMDGSLRSEMETGPAKVRRRFTATPVFVSLNYLMTGAQVQALDDFYATTTLQGSLRFDWNHPRRKIAVEARFMGPPVYSALGTIYRAQVDLEILP